MEFEGLLDFTRQYHYRMTDTDLKSAEGLFNYVAVNYVDLEVDSQVRCLAGGSGPIILISRSTLTS